MKHKTKTLIIMGLMASFSTEGALASEEFAPSSMNGANLMKFNENERSEDMSVLVSQSYRLGDAILLKS